MQGCSQALVFSATLEEQETWMDEVEQQLQSEDHGKDLSSVEHLLKRHTLLEGDVHNHGEPMDQIKMVASTFQESNHFMRDEIQDRAREIISRYHTLQQPMQIRRDNLEDALLLQRFLRDVEDEVQWITEKEPLAASNDLGNSLTAVQNLQKKHQALEAELVTHEPVVSGVVKRAQHMIRGNHFASQRIEGCITELTEKLSHLRDLASVRRLRLLDAVESQMFYAEANEADAWIREKRPLLSSADFGKDENSVQSLMKKLEGLERDLSNFQRTVGRLAKLSQGLVDRGHFDSQNIHTKQSEIETQFSELQSLAATRSQRLAESRKVFGFLREADEVSEWMGDQTVVAASEDYGRDVEHVELLIQRFESFLTGLNSNEGRVLGCLSSGRALISEQSPESDRILTRLDETQQLWEDLRELAHARQEALAGAKQVHVFDRTADETMAWIQEKDSALSSEGYGQDLETIQTLVRKHEGFETDLAAVKEQVESVVEEAKRLADLFPDARDHIEVKYEDTLEAWNELLDKSAQRRDKLSQAEQLQAYFDDYRDLIDCSKTESTKGRRSDLAASAHTTPPLPSFPSNALPPPRCPLDWSRSSPRNPAHQSASSKQSKRSRQDNKTEEEGWAQPPPADEYCQSLENHSGCQFLLSHPFSTQEPFELPTPRLSALSSGPPPSTPRPHPRPLQSWINEMIAKVTSPELAQDVPGAEILLVRHEEYKAEIDTRGDTFSQFYHTGNALILQGHFLANEIGEKIGILEQRRQTLTETWERRKTIYEQNLDTQVFKRDADLLENWIVSREPILHDGKLGETIPQVEELIRKHEDFEKTIEAQEEKLSALRRVTLLEEAFQKQQEEEQAARLAEKERIERERLEARKRREVQRITDLANALVMLSSTAGDGEIEVRISERRREDERRRVQEGRGPRDEINGSEQYEGSPRLNTLDVPVPGSIQKAGSVSQLFGDQMRREIKRAESMKVELKKPKRTPSFTTRRRTQSFRKLQRLEQLDQLPPVEIQGVLDRKHELQSGGKKAPVRSWKTYYTETPLLLEMLFGNTSTSRDVVWKHLYFSGCCSETPLLLGMLFGNTYTLLCGQLLCFFKDNDDFSASKAATAPIIIFKAKCEKAEDYTKRKHVFRLCCTDGSEFLFLAETERQMEDWINKISFHAQLPPSLQLLSYDDSHKSQDRLPTLGSDTRDGDVSSVSSRGSSPEVQRWMEHTDLSPMPQTQQARHPADRPPIPPRGAPPPVPTRSPSTEAITLRTKPSDLEVVMSSPRPQSYQPPRSAQNGGPVPADWRRSHLESGGSHGAYIGNNGKVKIYTLPAARMCDSAWDQMQMELPEKPIPTYEYTQFMDHIEELRRFIEGQRDDLTTLTHTYLCIVQLDMHKFSDIIPHLSLSSPNIKLLSLALYLPYLRLRTTESYPLPCPRALPRIGLVVTSETSGSKSSNQIIQTTNRVSREPPTAAVRPSSLPPYVAPPSALGAPYQGASGDAQSSSESEQHTPALRKDKRSGVLSSLFRKKRATNL
uniref:(California timema) hypothetical protein n=1 Tax=Timema californicum TaxID=61474 RepID=A0A7R9P8J9_TIMCA|nr:unnamed protein product [Timema californicum]